MSVPTVRWTLARIGCRELFRGDRARLGRNRASSFERVIPTRVNRDAPPRAAPDSAHLFHLVCLHHWEAENIGDEREGEVRGVWGAADPQPKAEA